MIALNVIAWLVTFAVSAIFIILGLTEDEPIPAMIGVFLLLCVLLKILLSCGVKIV